MRLIDLMFSGYLNLMEGNIEESYSNFITKEKNVVT